MAVDWTALVRQRGFVPPREFEDIGISEKAQGENAPGLFCAVSQARTSSLMMPNPVSTSPTRLFQLFRGLRLGLFLGRRLFGGITATRCYELQLQPVLPNVFKLFLSSD